MAITTRLQPRFLLQQLFAIAICFVLGLWGVYDYAFKIPTNTRAFERGRICAEVHEALGADLASASRQDEIREAQEVVRKAQADLLAIDAESNPTRDEVMAAIEAIKQSKDEQWLVLLTLFNTALAEASGRGPTQPTSPTYNLAYEAAGEGVDLTARMSPPGRFDRATQWMFILCLPFAPYFLWRLLQAKRRHYRLDEDGTLHGPEGAWAAEEIADIDMSRWMAKSVAFAVHRDGQRMKLDDYVYKDMHRLVGALAAARYPEQWSPDARRLPAGEDAPAEETAT